MKLSELDAAFYGAGGPGITDSAGNAVPERQGIGVLFVCPCGCGNYVGIAFANPLDGGAPRSGEPLWKRTGETIAELTLRPSIFRNPAKGGCGWHGFVTNGEARSV